MTNSSPASRMSPPMSPASVLPERGGNLASPEPDRAGHFLSLPSKPQRASCSVRLIREARSALETGCSIIAAKRADCVMVEQGDTTRLGRSRPCRHLPQPFEQLVAHGTYRNKVEAASPRPSLWRARRDSRRHSPAKSRTSLPFVQVNDISHFCFSVADTSGDSGRRFA